MSLLNNTSFSQNSLFSNKINGSKVVDDNQSLDPKPKKRKPFDSHFMNFNSSEY